MSGCCGDALDGSNNGEGSHDSEYRDIVCKLIGEKNNAGWKEKPDETLDELNELSTDTENLGAIGVGDTVDAVV